MISHPPKTLPVLAEGIPHGLKGLNQWVAWRWERRSGKWTKPPINPATGRYARNNDPDTWGSFEAALERMRKDALSGVGFMFHPDDGYAGVDLDDCRDPESGLLEPWAAGVVRAFDSYAEASPSGTGLKVFVRGELPLGRRRKGPVEMYDCGRFFTTTGHRLPGAPAEVRGRQEKLEALHARLFTAPRGQNGSSFAGAVDRGRDPGTSPASELADAELIEHARGAHNGEKFSRLYFEGDTSGYAADGNDGHSEADLALCSLLAFWAGPDAERIDRLFRGSALCRQKWIGRADYRKLTISAALERTEFWSGRCRTPSRARRVWRAGA